MGILRVDHPDIEEFIHSKQNSNRLNTFNLSIAITDEFVQAVQEGATFNLRFEGRQYGTVDAKVLWETIMRSTWDWAEPGVIFIDKVNEWNNLSYCETIGATNPCSEQPLPPFGACLLGSFNLTKYLTPAGPGKRFNLDLRSLAEDVSPVVRAMDNVVDVAAYPLAEQREMAVNTRRMG
jgi:ribonucleoside-diphosphate reductase alpha chain